MIAEILHYGRMPWPANWHAYFGRSAPLALEIGFGGGQNLVDMARKRPLHNVLGLEISLQSLRKGARKVHHAGLPYVRVLQGDSRRVLWVLFEPASIQEVTINFPDPWPKAGHNQRRLISENFLQLLATRMVADGLLDIATDHADYAAVIVECLENTPYFDSRLPTTYVTADPARLRTKYEQIALSEGRPCHYFKWRRNFVSAPDNYPIPKEVDMPHVVLQLAMGLEEVAGQFEPFSAQVADVNIKFLEMYRATRDGILLVEMYVSEEPYHQRVCLALRQRKQGDVVLSLHEVGFPRPTQGIHVAANELVRWLTNIDPDLRVVNSTLRVESSR